MRELIDKILLKWDIFWYTKKLKDNYVYKNDKRNIYLHVDPDEGLLKVFISGLLFRMPLYISVESDEEATKTLELVTDMNLSNAYTEDLQVMLKQYESEDNYEKCAEIRDILKTRNND
jgi:hypothetical protein